MSVKESETIHRYIEEIHQASGGVPPAEREEFLAEIRSQILDRMPETADLQKLLRAIGDPRQLAAGFKAQVKLREASRSFSPRAAGADLAAVPAPESAESWRCWLRSSATGAPPCSLVRCC